MLKKVADLTSQDFSKGLNTISNILNLSKDQSPNMMNVKVNFDGSIEKRLGSRKQNATIIASSGSQSWNVDSGTTLSTNIVSFWKLDEPSGTRDDSFGANDLSDNNSVGQASGIKNSSALFSASNSTYLLAGNNSSLETGDINFFLSTWFYLNSTSTTVQRSIISKKDIASGNNTVLLLHMDGSDGSTAFTDNSTSAHTITANGNSQIDTAQYKFGGASGLFDGNGDYLTAPDSLNWAFGTGDFTIDFWVRFSSVGNNMGLVGQFVDSSNYWGLVFRAGNTTLRFSVKSTGSFTVENEWAWNPSADTWYHVAVSRSGTSWYAFIDGVQIGATLVDADTVPDLATSLTIARAADNNNSEVDLNGWIDELRIVNGQAFYTSNFTVPTSAYSNPSSSSNFEYWLYVNTDQRVVFEVSSSGTVKNGQVIASSFGAVTTATWYNVVAWHDTSDIIGISLNLSVNSSSYSSGVRAGSAPLVIGSVSNGTGNFFDGRVDETGFWKRLPTAQNRSDLYNGGSGNTYNLAFSNFPWASFDFGASNNRWLTVAAGSGIYTSSDLGVNFVTIASSRTSTYQSFERSKNILIATSDAYDTPLMWTGSAGSQMTIFNTSAPLAKYCINFQGFTILLNTASRKRSFYYEDENTHITGDWADSFDLPSSADDETTTAFILRGTLYVSTRYALFRMSYVGGNPDWSFRKIKDWGFVPRTAKIITIKDVGEVCMGMSWDLKLRLFDGSDDKIVSDNIENNNMLCDFAMDNISTSGSGLVVSFAEHDNNDQNYKLCLAIGAGSTQTTHFINFNGRTQSFFPYNNMLFNTMVMAESANQQYLMAFDRAGYCHMMDSGNLDGGTTPIDDVFDSSLLYEKSPSEVSKSQKIDFYLSPTSSGTLLFRDRVDFGSDFKTHDRIDLSDTTNKIMIKKSINIPKTQGVYQWRITSSSNTANPWKLNRTDYFLSGLGIGQNE